MNKFILSLLLFVIASSVALAQNTVVSGTVTDAATKRPLSYVTVAFTGSSIGMNTDDKGNFSLKSIKPYSQITVSFVGYKTVTMPVKPETEQVINVRLFPDTKQLNEVIVKSGKKQRYRNKDNPAVELIRKVIENKPKNKPEAYNFVEYKEYDKTQMSFINVSEKLGDKKFFRKYKFFLDNKDSTLLPGKTLLPVFLTEKLSQNYYRRDPEKKKQITLGEKTVNIGAFLDSEGFSTYFKRMYNDIDIYQNNIFLMTNQFLSPIADAAPTFYKFFITDTVMVNNTKLIQLSFTPRNTTDMLFEGDIFITLDGNYAVQKANLTINKSINLNWVRTLHANLDFEQNPDGRWHMSRSDIQADFGISKKGDHGLFGERTITFKNYVINKPRPDTTYEGLSEITTDDAKRRTDQFWADNRLDTLSKAESKVYGNIDSLHRMPSYRRTSDIIALLLAGYKSFGKFEVGPSSTFYSFNPIEGLRLRLGGRTTPELSKRYYFETYGAYGFKDEKWKYFLSATYSLNDKSIYSFPQHYIRASYQHDTSIPGADLQFVQEDNFLLSFKRGVNDKYLYNDFYRLDYVSEFQNHFSYSIGLKNWKQAPAGSLYFNNFVDGLPNSIHDLTTTEATLQLRYAPHEQFYQGKLYRTPIFTKYPIITFNFTEGLKDVFGGEYNYSKVDLRIDKHTYFSQLGYADITLQGGNIFGKVPYPLLVVHRANQTYAYDLDSYNLMNFMEFVSDHYAAFTIDQHFNGFFFNKIPLLKRLKWRETFSFKALYGGVRDENNPALHPSLYQFPVESSGAPITYALGSKPYIEGSVGIENIFKFIRVDLVRRFNYLDHPNAPEWGIRTRVKFDF
ncbi:DUF5686 and carboxypeptidase-like regulatory domain-containing protein [Mucilaginibacter sp. KACC 22063]|uniref:DUF5686 and carboxypeptidase-like regulatory domain-containing protein n=1 Tax=Mucilaginibacter sp. KACC 22063 TaxID=3025666 RepID=UPI002366ADB0|nr:DUF5686 and carboxypeptidase-like regulatory domain-containing protein [Mucilaginibacter sp. KACC 22063]WDF53761.1 DUF5686 family protein [Mucilaginibacter sp. KACC 22063]